MKEKLEGQIGILNEQIKAASGSDQHFQETRKRSYLPLKLQKKNREKSKIIEEKKKIDEELAGLLKNREAVSIKLNEVMQTIHSVK